MDLDCYDALAAIPGNYATPAPDTLSYLPKGGVQLAYQGHAEITLALIDCDACWSWEPAAIDPDTGGPVIRPQDKRLVMWGYLTVLGVRRLAVGTCDISKAEPEKELIGDLLRNGAMRFGIATKLWSKADSADPAGTGPAGGYTSPRPARQTGTRAPQRPAEPARTQTDPNGASDAQTKLIAIECQKAGIEEKNRVEFVGNLVGRPIKSTHDLTKAEASAVIEQMKSGGR